MVEGKQGIDPGPSRPREVERGDALWRRLSLPLFIFLFLFLSRVLLLCQRNARQPPLHDFHSAQTRSGESDAEMFLGVPGRFKIFVFFPWKVSFPFIKRCPLRAQLGSFDLESVRTLFGFI